MKGSAPPILHYTPSFYLHLRDSTAYWEMIEGHRIYASRKVAEKIAVQTRYAAEFYNVDVRQDQRYLAEKDLFPCGERDESRFLPDFEIPLSGALYCQDSGGKSVEEANVFMI